MAQAGERAEAAAKARNALGLDLFRALSSENENDNLALSPYSISTALKMTFAAANGEPCEEMARVLHLPDDSDAIPPGAKALNETFLKDTHIKDGWFKGGKMLLLVPDDPGEIAALKSKQPDVKFFKKTQQIFEVGAVQHGLRAETCNPGSTVVPPRKSLRPLPAVRNECRTPAPTLQTCHSSPEIRRAD